jgi:hypothetical protein
MSIEYFGWLTKGRCQISLLDILVLFIEIGLVVAAVLMFYFIKDKIKAKL